MQVNAFLLRIVWILATTKMLGYFNFSLAIENYIWIARRAIVENNKRADWCMGLMLTPQWSWNLAHNKLASQARIYAVRSYQKRLDTPYLMRFKIFYTMVKPVLCYGSQIWGFQYNNTIEDVHNSFCTQILFVRKTINTCMVLGKCGRLPLCITYMTNCIRYWCTLQWVR